jgi:hypothetical protein
MNLPPPPNPQYEPFRKVGVGCAWLIIVSVIVLCLAFVIWMVRVLL